MSEIVERSIKECPWSLAGPYSFPPEGALNRAMPVLNGNACASSDALINSLNDLPGALQAPMDHGTDRPGSDYAFVSTVSAEQCRDICVADGQCRSFTFVPSLATCCLKSNVPPPSPAPSMSSAFVRGQMEGGTVEYNVRRTGTLYYGLSTGTYGTCALNCLNNAPACVAASFREDTFHCELLQSISSPQPSAGTHMWLR